MIDSELLSKAFKLAARYHAGQLRKGSNVPYLGHLLGVTELVFMYGGRSVEAAAALLHDSVEDGGGLSVLDEIRRECGDEVAAIVEACTDSTVDTTAGQVKKDWWTRKRAYIAHLQSPDVAPGSLLVSACDKLHNLTATVADYEAGGDDIWRRFKTGWEGQLWYYRTLAGCYEAGGDPRAERVTARLRHEIGCLERLLTERGHDVAAE